MGRARWVQLCDCHSHSVPEDHDTRPPRVRDVIPRDDSADSACLEVYRAAVRACTQYVC